MSETAETMAGATYDELLGEGRGLYRTRWVTFDSGTTIERGALLAGNWDDEASSVTVTSAIAGDIGDNGFFIASRDAEEEDTGMPAYESGSFLRSGIKVGAGLKITDFELELRRQDIHLTEVI